MSIMTQDPHGIIPVGFSKPGQYEVVGFCDPGGQDVLILMVCVKYPTYQDNGQANGYSTTQDYVFVLKDFLAATDNETIRGIQHAFLMKIVSQDKRNRDVLRTSKASGSERLRPE